MSLVSAFVDPAASVAVWLRARGRGSVWPRRVIASVSAHRSPTARWSHAPSSQCSRGRSPRWWSSAGTHRGPA